MKPSIKTPAERSIEALTWAAVVIWLGFALVAHILNYVWLVVMMLGIILLSSAIYQRSRGWHTSLSLWIFGIWMAVFSVVETVSSMVGAISGNEGLGIDLWVYLGIALVSMGVAVVFRTVQGPQLAGDRRAPSRRQEEDTGYTAYGRGGRRYSAPRRVEEDTSSGYIPSPQDRAQYDDYAQTSRPQRSRRSQPQPRQDDQYTQSSQRGSRYDDQYTQPSQRAPRQDDQYTQPSQRRSRYEQPPEQQYTQPSQRAPRYEAPPEPPPARERQRAAPPPRQRRSRPVEEPDNLDSRVDDIIRRSRERRGGEPAPGGSGSGDDLPY